MGPFEIAIVILAILFFLVVPIIGVMFFVNRYLKPARKARRDMAMAMTSMVDRLDELEKQIGLFANKQS